MVVVMVVVMVQWSKKNIYIYIWELTKLYQGPADGCISGWCIEIKSDEIIRQEQVYIIYFILFGWLRSSDWLMGWDRQCEAHSLGFGWCNMY